MTYIIVIIIVIIVLMKAWEIVKNILEEITNFIGILVGNFGATAVVLNVILCVLGYLQFGILGLIILAICDIFAWGISCSSRKRNEESLLEELQKNCTELGHMDNRSWKERLGNYATKKYPRETSFDMITKNFAEQLEMQNITKNEDWFTPYINYIIKNPQGVSAEQLLDRVVCNQLKITHFTPDKQLVKSRLEYETKEKANDVPGMLTKVPAKIAGGSELYQPSEYALHKYNINSDNGTPRKVEIAFEDL